MDNRMVVIGGWRAYALAAVVLALLVAATIAAGVVLLVLVAVGAVLVVGHRALRALGLVGRSRTVRASSGLGTIVEGRFQVVERRLDDPARETRAT